MKDMDRQQHLSQNDGKTIEKSEKNEMDYLPVSEMAETDALGGCCSKKTKTS